MVLSFEREVTIMPGNSATLILNDGDYEYLRSLIRTRELIRIICQSNEVEILAGHVGNDHIHLLVSVPLPRREGGCTLPRVQTALPYALNGRYETDSH